MRNTLSHISASLALAALLPLAACNDAPDADHRFLPVGADEVKRAVLVEEFTGQLCVNCPTAHTELARITEMFGHDNVIVVAIHGNSTQMAVPAPSGLGTAVGADYCRANGISAWPSAVVNRSSGDLGMNYGKWLTAVVDALATPEEASVTASCSLEPGSGTLRAEVTVTPADGVTLPADTRLQMWLVEDHVTALQFMPDGSIDREYVHHHVLRAAINGDEGQSIGAMARPVTVAASAELHSKWNPAHLRVVALAWTPARGVLGVTRSSAPVSDPTSSSEI